MKKLLSLILPFWIPTFCFSTTQEVKITVHPDKPKQTIKGIGFEIQSDSIGSGNHGLPEEPIAIPHDLIPEERERLAKEMLKGFRYCRLAGGLYWRGLDKEQKYLQPRWPEQLQELKTLLDTAGVEGLSFEYWSPAPYWKTSRAFIKGTLRCFSENFAQDSEYKGDTDRFLADFAKATVRDVETLQKAGLKVSMWGLQNEPSNEPGIYSSCRYPDSPSYVKAYTASASALRAFDPKIMLFADTRTNFPSYIGPAMNDPKVASLVDAYVVHTVGTPASSVASVHDAIRKKLPERPWFQNEYEYLTGGATPDRCLNTVQHIMNSFQIADNPTWFWIHCLKPLKNAEASGYSLGFWKSLIDKPKSNSSATQFCRWVEGPEFTALPEELKSLEMVSGKMKNPATKAIAYNFIVNQPVTVYLIAENLPELKLAPEWIPTEMKTAWEGGDDRVFKREFPKGKIIIPASKGKNGDRSAAPHSAFVQPSNVSTFKPQIGLNMPIEIRSESIALEQQASSIKPGHWIYNPYNWYAVGSFVKRMPWDSVAVHVESSIDDKDFRWFAFKRPNGKMTVVLANRNKETQSAEINSGIDTATWKGIRYTPEEAGENTLGVPIGTQTGRLIKSALPTLSWEFWEEQ